MKRYLSLLLACLVLIGTLSFASCGNNTDKEPITGSTGTEAVTESPYDANGYLKDSLPDTLNYNEAAINILANENQKDNFYSDGQNGEMINDALYLRSVTVEERLGVKLNWVFQPGDWNARDTFMGFIDTDVSAGTGSYDAVIAYNLIPPAMAIKGLCANLLETVHIDIKTPWWPKGYLDQMVLNNKLYGVAESTDVGLLRNMMCVFFNTKLITDYNLEDPYELVENGKWTIDKVISMTKNCYLDLNSNSTADAEDQYGLTTGTKPKLDAWFYGFGYSLSAINTNGALELTMDSEKIGKYITDITSRFHNNPDVYIYDKTQYTMFLEGRAVFYAIGAAMAEKTRETDISFGVAPMPMLNESQGRYYTHLSNTYDVWCVPVSSKDYDRSSALLECMASESYRQVYEVYFEEALKTKYAPDSKVGAVYDTIRESVVFDFTYLYSCAFDRMPMLYIRDCVADNNTNWASQWASISEVIKTKFNTIVDAFRD